MQHCIAEHSVKFLLEGQFFSRHHIRVQSEPPCGLDLCSARINCYDLASDIRQFLRQHPVSATKVKNALARLWRQQLHDRPRQIRNEPCVTRITNRIPSLCCGHRTNSSLQSSRNTPVQASSN